MRSRNTALVLLAAALVGPEVLLISQVLDLEYEFVEKIGNRMTASGLWMAEDVYTEDWVYEPFFDGFFEHIAVAEGLVAAVPTTDGFNYFPARETNSHRDVSLSENLLWNCGLEASTRYRKVRPRFVSGLNQ